MRGREYRFFSDHILCLETRAYFFFSHNLFRPPHEPILFLSPVLHQKSGTKDKKATKGKKTSLAGENVGEAQCAGGKPVLSHLL